MLGLLWPRMPKLVAVANATDPPHCSPALLHLLAKGRRRPHGRHLPGCCYGTCQLGRRGYVSRHREPVSSLLVPPDPVPPVSCFTLLHLGHSFVEKPGKHRLREQRWFFNPRYALSVFRSMEWIMHWNVPQSVRTIPSIPPRHMAVAVPCHPALLHKDTVLVSWFPPHTAEHNFSIPSRTT